LLRAIEENLDKINRKALAQDNATFTILTLNVKDSQITHIQECSTAKQAWDSFRTVHQGIGASGRLVLIQRLWVLRMVEGDHMAEHLKKFRELANQVGSLSANGKGMEENEWVTLLSLSLPESYEPVIKNLQSRADNVSFDIFAGQVLQESARRQVANNTQQPGGQSTPVAGFTVRLPAHGQGAGRLGRRRGGMCIPTRFTMGRYQASSTAGRGNATLRGKGKSFYCHSEGHWKRDCYKKKNDEAKEACHHSPNSQTSLAFVVADNPGKEEDPGRWILDSGATQYLYSRKNYFIPGT